MPLSSFRKLSLSILVAFSVTPAAFAEKPTPRIDSLVDGMYPQLETIYKDIHANPELSFKETRTAAKLAAEMRAIGFEMTERVGGTGMVAIYKNGPGPTVLVRTELDALPMEEKTGLPYASKVKADWNGRETFVAHSCGHDIHMASWIGTARTLVALKDQWKGTLMFIGQPAEEAGGGAKAMLADGLFKRFPKPDFAFALHTSPSPYGFVGYRVGAITSAADGLEITFKGRGGHGSAPDKTIDPIAIAAHFVTDVQTVVSREKDPAEFGVVTIGAIQGEPQATSFLIQSCFAARSAATSRRCARRCWMAYDAPQRLQQQWPAHLSPWSNSKKLVRRSSTTRPLFSVPSLRSSRSWASRRWCKFRPSRQAKTFRSM